MLRTALNTDFYFELLKTLQYYYFVQRKLAGSREAPEGGISPVNAQVGPNLFFRSRKQADRRVKSGAPFISPAEKEGRAATPHPLS
jgi:hypothetical protein